MTGERWKKVFVAEGFEFKGQRGTHRRYAKPGIGRPIVIPTYREVSLDIILANLRTARMSRERYFELLDEVS